jgi:hypothetical protein
MKISSSLNPSNGLSCEPNGPLCPTAYVDEDVAARAAYLSAALSRACHYHPYELAPTASELTRWLTETADLVALLRSRVC